MTSTIGERCFHYCHTCHERGKRTPTQRLVVGLPMCDECFSGRPVRVGEEAVAYDRNMADYQRGSERIAQETARRIFEREVKPASWAWRNPA